MAAERPTTVGTEQNGVEEQHLRQGSAAAAVVVRDGAGRLVYRPGAGGEPVVNVRVARCFPWSFPSGYISIRNADGEELCLASSLNEFPPETRKVVEEELAAQEFIPRVTAIEEVSEEFDVAVWKVRTDCGRIRLEVKDADDVRSLPDGRVVIRDHAGGLFVCVPGTLDARSRRLLEERLG